MDRQLRLLDHVYRKNDPRRIEGKIISAEETEDNELKYIVFFPGEVNYFYYFASELVLCNNSSDTIFSSNIFQQHPFQPQELTETEVTTILDTDIDNPNSRRILWYDILFYKLFLLSDCHNKVKQGNFSIHPTILRLIRYPIPDEIRCFLWSEFLGVRNSFEIGYYSILRNKQSAIPYTSLHVIEADLRRMEITPHEYRQLFRLLTSIYLHNPNMGYVQGMHFLAYSLLHIFSEEEAFFVFLRIVNFLPANYYGKNLEGVNTDLLVVAATLNKFDSFLYSNVESISGNMVFFLSPVYKWLVDLFSNPFQLQFTYQLLDILFCFGNWAFVLAPIALIIDNRQQFIACTNLGDITNIFTYIPEQYKENDSILKIIYELCLVADIKEINELRNHLRTDSVSSSCGENHEELSLDEQNGLVCDLYNFETNSDMCLSLQMSLHMQQISSSFMRVSGVDDCPSQQMEEESSSLAVEMDTSNHLLTFNELSDCYEEEMDINPWRESILDEDSILSEGKVLSNPLSKRNSLDFVEDSCESDAPVDETVISTKPHLQFPKKWIQADILFKKVLSVYDNIHNQRTYHITNNCNENVTDGHLLLSHEIVVDSNYLSNYQVLSLLPN